MKKKNMFFVSTCAIILMSVLVLSVYAATDDGKLDSKPAANDIDIADEQIVISDDYSEKIAQHYKIFDKTLTNEQLLMLAELYHSQNADPGWESLPYQEGIIIGEVDPNAPRLNLAAARKIISEHNDFDEILFEFYKVQYPDYIGGSGVSLLIYQLSEYEEISIIIEQRDIAYAVFNPDGTVKSTEMLFE